jgi:hypothetical protein
MTYDGDIQEERILMRSEMVVQICKIIGIDEELVNEYKNIESEFTDVPAGEWYTGWINLAVENGLIVSDEDEFRPSDEATLNEAIEMIIRALGRGEYVSQNGTYPGNFVNDAKILFTNDIDMSKVKYSNKLFY